MPLQFPASIFNLHSEHQIILSTPVASNLSTQWRRDTFKKDVPIYKIGSLPSHLIRFPQASPTTTSKTLNQQQPYTVRLETPLK
jgi:hypothetical protein